MKKVFGIASLVTGLFAGVTAHAGILNVPYFAGQFEDCTKMFIQEAVVASIPHVGCGIQIPIPLESGRLLKQVRLLYSSSQNSGDFRITGEVMSKIYKTMPDAGQVEFVVPIFDSTTNPGAGMVAGAFMAQSGIPPHISYTDAFVLQPDRTYSVNAVIVGDAMFHGIQLVYE